MGDVFGVKSVKIFLEEVAEGAREDMSNAEFCHFSKSYSYKKKSD